MVGLLLATQRRWAAMGVTTLLWGVGVLCVFILYLAYMQPTGVHVVCECGREVETAERAARHLPHLMAELDPASNRTAEEAAEAWHPSLAVKFLVAQENRGSRCHVTPGLFSVRHSNLYWQEALVSSTTFLIYGAYYDPRDHHEGPLVRVLVMVEEPWPPTPTCHLWYSTDAVPTATKAIRMDYIHWQEPLAGHWMPYLVTCRARSDSKGMPEVVSLVSHACDQSTNALRVYHHQQQQQQQQQEHQQESGEEQEEEQAESSTGEKKDLALCHKFIFNPSKDFSKRLVEWLEAARAWGVDEVTVYEGGSVHPNVSSVLQHYQHQGFLHLLPWTNPGFHPSIPHLNRALYDTQRYDLFTMENVPYTDCLLRHINTHRYVGVWDMDEFVLPTTHASIPAMLDEAKARAESLGLRPTSYLARCSYYFDDQSEEPSDDLPEYLHLLRHVTRTVKITPLGVFTKSLHDTSNALALHAHFALFNLNGTVDRNRDLYHLYPGNEAHLAHYRAKCQGESQEECQTDFRPFQTRDTTMWRHRQAITRATTQVLLALRLIPP